MTESWNSCIGFLLLISVTMVSLNSTRAAVPLAIYIFGDSTADVGTNNHFNETSPIAKADFPYNGIDFPLSRSTGRFSNGLNTADFLSKLMGFRRSPSPFLDLLDGNTVRSSILKGVNFASGGSGVLDDTGTIFGKVVSLSEQIHQFTRVSSELEKILGRDPAKDFLSKSMFFVSVGGNDIFQNFLLNGTSDKQEYINKLKFAYENQLRMLYSLGARKFGIISVPPIGCCPSQRVNNATGCIDDLNVSSLMFYNMAQAMLQKLSAEYKDMIYALGNAYEMVMNIIDNPLPFKFTNLTSACCGTGTLNGEGPCSPSATVCPNRQEYLFWDWIHPTQAAAELAALTLYGGSQRFVTPINFKQLQDSN